jgi:hypothetical protein
MKVLIIRDPMSDAIKKEAENLVEIGPCKNYGSQAGLGPTRGPRVFGPGLTT